MEFNSHRFGRKPLTFKDKILYAAKPPQKYIFLFIFRSPRFPGRMEYTVRSTNFVEDVMNRIHTLRSALKKLNLKKTAGLKLTVDELAKISGTEWLMRYVERMEKENKQSELEYWKPRLIDQHRGLTPNASVVFDLFTERGLKVEPFIDLIENRKNTMSPEFNKINKQIIAEWFYGDLVPITRTIIANTDYTIHDDYDENDLNYMSTEDADTARIEDRKRNFDRDIKSRDNSYTIPAAMMDISRESDYRAEIVLALFNRILGSMT